MNWQDHCDLLALADRVLARVPHGDAELVIDDVDASLTRFANNAIHQNVSDNGLRMRLRIVHEQRVGVSAIGGNVDGKLDDLIAAAEAARASSPASETTALPDPDHGADQPVGYSEATATADPERRSDGVARIVAATQQAGLLGFGAFDTAIHRQVVVNTRGVRRAATSTHSGLVAVARGDSGAGYASRCAVNVDDIDADGLASEVVDTCSRNQGAEPAPPGDYEVVLSPYAVSGLVGYLSMMGFSGLTVEEGQSFMKPGERLMSRSINIYDDAAEAEGAAFPFDAEGVSARRVDFIAAGTCREVIHDSATGLRAGVPSTGHALPFPNTSGPLASHLAIGAGEDSLAQLIAGVVSGIYVTRLWYIRVVHPLRTIVTGMTREGTFRIRDGKLAEPIRDLRFTQSIVEAFADVRGVGRERLLTLSDEDTAVLVPALRLGHFTFSS